MTDAAENTVELGFLYPGYAAEDDYPRLAKLVGAPVSVEVIHTSFEEDAHRVDALREMGSVPRLLEGAKSLAGRDVGAVMWSSTSASFVLGWEGAEEQATVLKETLGVPASTTAFAFVNAAAALGVRRVAIAATYPDDIASRFETFLDRGGVEVCHIGSHGIVTAAEVGTLGRDAVLEMVAGNDHVDASAVLVPDTALHTAAWIEDLEAALGKPVLTANQVTFWEALRLAGRLQPQEGLGALFRNQPVPAP